MKMKTRRKTKIIGQRTFIDQETGEIVNLGVIQTEQRDFNFEKLWMGHIIQAIDIIGNKKMKVAMHILESRNRDNVFFGTMRDLEKKLNVSLPTIAETIKALQDNDVIVSVQQGVYRLNPDVIFKGTVNNRMDILIRYQKEKEEVEKEKNEQEQEEPEYIHEEFLEMKIKELQEQLESLIQEKVKINQSKL